MTDLSGALMILRTWHGAVPVRHGDAFEQHFRDDVLGGIQSAPGNLGAYFRRVTCGAYSHVYLLTYWRDWASVRQFAGDPPYVAVAYPDDEKYGLVAAPIVVHQEC